MRNRVIATLGSELAPGEQVLEAVRAEQRIVARSIDRAYIALMSGFFLYFLARIFAHAGSALFYGALALAVLALAVSLAWLVRSQFGETGSPLPRRFILAVTTKRVWFCGFRPGRVATPTSLEWDYPLTEIADVKAGPREVTLVLTDGSHVACRLRSREGASLVGTLRRVLEPRPGKETERNDSR
jgi:hypothetical protein